MAVFSYIYYNSYVAPTRLSVGAVLGQVMKLTSQQQVSTAGAWGWWAGFGGKHG